MRIRSFITSALVAATVVAVSVATGPTARAMTSSWNLSSDWAVGANPDGAWSYGWESSRGSSFNLMTIHQLNTGPGIDYWFGGISGVGGPYYPEVAHNGSSSTYTFSCCVLPGNSVVLHPGPGGQNAVVRWTAPVAGSYDVRATWTGIDYDASGTTTDDAVLRDGTHQLFAGEVTGYQATQMYTGALSMMAGETLDFTVGSGSNGSYLSDSTGLAVTITQAASADTTPPTVTATGSPAPNAAGWNDTDVTVSFTCTDAGSGVDVARSALADVVLSASGTATATCFDNAGNSASASYTAKIDKVPPTVTYSGNAVTYDVDQSVSITCTASDDNSGVASTTCADVVGPAAAFALGTNTFSASATDNAGNVGTGAVTFTLVVTPTGLSALATRYIEGSPKYAALRPVQQGAVVRIATGAVRALATVIARAPAQRKPILTTAFSRAVGGLASAGWLTADQAATLTRLAGGL